MAFRSFLAKEIEVGSGVPTSTGREPRLYLDIDSSIFYVKGEGDAGWGPIDASIDGLTATAAELNALDGITSSVAELNILDGVTATAAELNTTDGVTATYSEINSLDDSAAFVRGLSRVRLASAPYDFAIHGGAISAIDLSVEIPDNAIILDGMVDVITTLTSTTDAATVAVSVEGADDMVAAIAISDVSNPWDVGLRAIVPLGTAATAVKTTAARAVTVTIATEAVTAGKFIVFLRYVLSE